MPIGFVETLQKTFIVARYELLKQLRRFRLYGLVAVGSAATFAAIMIVLFSWDIGTTSASTFSYLIISYGQVSSFALIAGVFFSGDAIASEFEHKTGYLMFLNPITKTTLLVGKFISSCLACILVVTMPYFILSVGVMAIFGQYPIEILLSYLFAVFYACSVASLTFIFSSLFKGAMGASILPFLLIFFVFPIFSAVFMLTGIEPFVFIDYGGQIAANILLNPYPPNKISIPIGAGGIEIILTQFYATVAEGIVIMGSYLAAGLILSLILMRRRQMT